MNGPENHHAWVPDLGDGTYRNPVLFADYSDPDMIRVGGDFYLTASSFSCTPGLPILHSRDLVNWTIINHALKNLPDARYDEVRHGEGVWAPAIRQHAGKFRIFFPTPDEGIYVISAEDPAGEWSEPHLLLEGKGLIDPCPFWDDDGQAYMIHAYAGSRAGIRNKLHIRPMTADATEITGAGVVVAEIPPELPALEGPKMHKRNGWYYILAPAGGVATGWQSVFRSRDIYGPYEEKIVLAQRDTPVNGPHQGALVDTPDGEWWFIHFQDMDPYGRIVHLQPVRWESDWPLIGEAQDENGVGRPVLAHAKPIASTTLAVPQTSDDFSCGKLGLQWQWHANHRDDWHSLTARPGYLRLHPLYVANSDFALAPNLLMQKFPGREFTVETELELPPGHPNLHAGLIVMGGEYAALDVRRDDSGYQLRLSTADETRRMTGRFVILRVTVGKGGLCRFEVSDELTPPYQIGPAFQAKPGQWIGAKTGLYCITTDAADPSGFAEFARFQILAPAAEKHRLTPISQES